PTVAVSFPDAKTLISTIDLPGRLEAYYRAPIFARVSGYLKSWSADIGAKVKAGQVIAEIEAPDLDQQLLQARADLASQQASAKAIIIVPDYPNRSFEAMVEASSQSVDVASGTTRMQLALDNPKSELMPGGYASVKLSLASDNVPLHIPASALIFNQNGLRVA